MLEKIKPLIIFFLFLTLLVRVLLFFQQSFHIDMDAWIAWTLRLVEVGPSNFYSEDYYSVYFPGYLYLLWIMGILFNSSAFEIVIKFTTTLFDIGTAFYLYKIVLRYNKSWAILAPLLYLSNPAIVFNSSVWGQVDGVFTFFLVYSTFLLLELKKPFKWSIFNAIAILIKPQGIALLPVAIFENFKKFSIFKSLKALIILPLTLIIFSLPFFLNDFFGLFRLGYKLADLYPFTSLYAFNFWSIVNWWEPDSQKFFIFSYKTWGIILYIFAQIMILLPLFRKTKNPLVYMALSLSLLAFFLFPTRIHERYLFPFFAFFLISAFVIKSKLFTFLYFLTSGIHLLNLWFVYHFYNFIYANPQAKSHALFIFLDKYHSIFSIAMLLIYVLLFIVYLRLFYDKNKVYF